MTVEVYNIHLTATLQKYVLIVKMGKVDQHYYNYKYKSPFVNIDWVQKVCLNLQISNSMLQ